MDSCLDRVGADFGAHKAGPGAQKEDGVKDEQSSRQPKNLVICCDGTGKAFGDQNTNVVRLFEAVQKDDLFGALEKQRRGETAQLAFYDPGVGSLNPNARYSWSGRLGMTLSKAFGMGFRRNVLDGYRFLMANYQPGDQVYLFGFSRGAFTVRWLAGVIHMVGLLHRGNENLLDHALELALDESKAELAGAFKEFFSRECKPRVVGVWDTVSSLGLLTGRRFPNLVLNPDVAHAFQALSIDERRQKFPAVLWDERHRAPGQEILQVWFAGDHSDVGGGHDLEDAEFDQNGLSNTTLLWMLTHARRCGLQVSDEALADIRSRADCTGPVHDLYRGWWRLLGYDLRTLPRGAKVHRSVLERMQKVPHYRPNVLPSAERLDSLYTLVDTPAADSVPAAVVPRPATHAADAPPASPGNTVGPSTEIAHNR